jgi:hypothetical protein
VGAALVALGKHKLCCSTQTQAPSLEQKNNQKNKNIAPTWGLLIVFVPELSNKLM